MGEYFAFLHVGLLAQGFHHLPDVGPVQGTVVFGDEHRAFHQFLLLQIPAQQLFQLPGDQDPPGLPLQLDHSFSPAHCVHRDIFQFRDPDPCAADRLEQDRKFPVPLPLCCLNQLPVLLLRQLPPAVTVGLLLDPDLAYFQFPFPQIIKKAVQRRNLRVDAGRLVAFLQPFLVGQHRLPGHLTGGHLL